MVSGYDAGMSDLIAFCNARISEKEARAREVQQHFDDGRFDDLDGPGSRVEEAAQARREAWAMRSVLTRHSPVTEPGRGTRCGWCSGEFDVAWPCEDARSVAAIWSDHPDYQEGWKPCPSSIS